ncbi:hypothetical protein A8L45_13700 [Veronia pacifica]|uniref:PsbP C-terminal domain-containing protein n=1 Tax=Veronia pacifica TaxID=1080227 RepID=A0A1C3EGD0_9GAMM|nr:hypothetical protein A8L45_13700 [Veronia pacifica]
MKSLIKCYVLFFSLIIYLPSAFSDSFVRVNALGGKVSLLVPENFSPMSEDIIKVKYPSSRRPSEVLSDKTGSVTLAFNHTNNAMSVSDIKSAHSYISKMFRNTYPSAIWFRDEIIEQNGHVYMVMELITPVQDTNIHNIIYGTSVDNRYLLTSFNTTVEQSEEWLPLGKKMMASLTVVNK